MPESFDVVIAGLGAMGSAAAYHVAARGRRVLGLDRFTPPHTLGSSHGSSRIIREAYFEHPLYVPLVQRAYDLWQALERDIGARLLHPTGGLMIGPRDGALVRGARHSAITHGLRHEVLSGDEIRRRFPALRAAGDMVGVWEPRAGILFPEACVAAHLALAARHGAQIQCDEAVLEWRPDGSGVEVVTTRGTYRTARFVVAAGAWASRVVPELAPVLTVERQVLFWFQPPAPSPDLDPSRCPISVWEHAPERLFYAFPDLGEGVKVAIHHEGESSDPERVDRSVAPVEVARMRELVSRLMPLANGPLRASVVCLYTNTPDGHFLLDAHPRHPQVLIASPCSGHGFKFAAAVGEIIADLVTEGRTGFDVSPFRMARFPKRTQ